MNTRASSAAPTDIGRLLDDGPFSLVQYLIVMLSALAIVMDGFDGQMIAYAIPAITKEWNVARSAFAPVIAVGLIGMGVGAAVAGLMADRFGRRPMVLGSVILFGVATSLIGFAPNLLAIGCLRFIAGLGIGGALPTATTLAAESTPTRRRALAVTATIVCYPLGGMLAGLFAMQVLSVEGWRALFWIGGSVPVAVGGLLFFALPESPRYLARRPQRWDELRRLLQRMAHHVPQHTGFSDAAEQRHELQGGVGALLTAERRRDTLALWGAFFMCMLGVYSAASWLPTMLFAEGLPPSAATAGLTAYNLGGVVGALLCAVAITRLGSRWPMALCAVAAAGSAFALKGVDIAHDMNLFVWGIGLHGLFANAVQATLYALSAHLYPTRFRATGTAASLTAGRFGAILSSFAGAAVISAGGSGPYLNLLGVAMLGAGGALLLIKRHVPSPRRVAISVGTSTAQDGV